MSIEEQIEELWEDVFRKCNTCFKQIHKDDPYIVAYKKGYPVCFCKEHIQDAEHYLDWFQEFVEVK